MRLRHSLVAALLSGLAGALPAAAQQVRGHVVDAATGRPVAGATVELQLSGERVRAQQTDSAGAFHLRGPGAGVYTLRVQRIGYRAASETRALAGGDVWLAPLRLAALPVALEGVSARAGNRRSLALETSGYEERRERGMGRSLTREQIVAARASNLTDLLRRFPSLTVIRGENDVKSMYDVRLAGSFGPRDAAAPCLPSVYIDGNLVREGGQLAMRGINGLIAPSDVEVIEVHTTSGTLPPAIRATSSFCGTILIWRRL